MNATMIGVRSEDLTEQEVRDFVAAQRSGRQVRHRDRCFLVMSARFLGGTRYWFELLPLQAAACG